MNQLVAQAAELQRVVDARGWRSCIIGGLAVVRWGEPRLTRDVDITLFTGFGAEEPIARALLELFEPRIQDALEFAMVNRVLLLQGSSGVPIDIALAGFPFEEEIIDRASTFEYLPGIALRTASAEDVIVLKAFANRRRDWSDIAGIIARQRSLDWDVIVARLSPLVELKGESEILIELDRVRAESEEVRPYNSP